MSLAGKNGSGVAGNAVATEQAPQTRKLSPQVTYVGATLPPSAIDGFHRMTNLVYPRLATPLSLERAIILLSKAQQFGDKFTYGWYHLNRPEAGECFLEVLPQVRRLPVDGYEWFGTPLIENVTVNGTRLEVYKYVQSKFNSQARPEQRVIRVEYRLDLPNQSYRLGFSHYLLQSVCYQSAQQPQHPHHAEKATVASSIRPISSATNLAAAKATKRPSAASSKVAIGDASKADRFVASPQSAVPRGEEAFDLDIDESDRQNRADQALLRMKIRECLIPSILMHLGASGDNQLTTQSNPEEEEIQKKIKALEVELVDLQAKAAQSQESFANAREQNRKILDEICATHDQQKLESDLQLWLGQEKLRVISHVSRIL